MSHAKITTSTGMPSEKQTTRNGITKAVGVKIAGARASLGRTQGYLAAVVDLNTQVVSHYETGVSPPSIERLCLLASALDVEPGELLPSLKHIRSLATMSGRPVRAMDEVEVVEVEPLTPKDVCAADIGRRIESRRVAAGLTQQDVAWRMADNGSRAITRSAISQWENGQAMPMVDRLCEVAAALGCEPGELLTG